MNRYFLDNDTRVICIKADTFPAGVLAAHQKLHALVGNDVERKYFGISYPERRGGNIIYKAAATEQYDGEAETLNCECFIVRRGNYASIFIKDFMQNISAIGNAFQQLLAQPGIDPTGYCLEIYEGRDDVRCLVPVNA